MGVKVILFLVLFIPFTASGYGQEAPLSSPTGNQVTLKNTDILPQYASQVYRDSIELSPLERRRVLFVNLLVRDLEYGNLGISNIQSERTTVRGMYLVLLGALFGYILISQKTVTSEDNGRQKGREKEMQRGYKLSVMILTFLVIGLLYYQDTTELDNIMRIQKGTSEATVRLAMADTTANINDLATLPVGLNLEAPSIWKKVQLGLERVCPMSSDKDPLGAWAYYGLPLLLLIHLFGVEMKWWRAYPRSLRSQP